METCLSWARPLRWTDGRPLPLRFQGPRIPIKTARTIRRFHMRNIQLEDETFGRPIVPVTALLSDLEAAWRAGSSCSRSANLWQILSETAGLDEGCDQNFTVLVAEIDEMIADLLLAKRKKDVEE